MRHFEVLILKLVKYFLKYSLFYTSQNKDSRRWYIALYCCICYANMALVCSCFG